MKYLLTVKEAADYLRLAESTIYKMVSRKDIPFLKIGTRVIFDRDTLSSWTEELTVQPIRARNRGGNHAA